MDFESKQKSRDIVPLRLSDLAKRVVELVTQAIASLTV
jgi:hypothetical protein